MRQQPASYIPALAFNLSVDSGESDGLEALQDVANTIVEAIHRSPARSVSDGMSTTLASLARYGHVEVSLDDPKYAVSVAAKRCTSLAVEMAPGVGLRSGLL